MVDSTTIPLIANSLDWVKHRRRKAAQMLLRLDLRFFLPNFILVKTAGTHDSTEAAALCEKVNEGEIVIFDKAYVDFKHFWRLFQHSAKGDMKSDVEGQQVIQSVCEPFLNRHIYQDSLLYNPTQQKRKTGNG